MEAKRTLLTCPDCGGVIERIEQGGLVQYRCRIGHTYTAESAMAAHNLREENTLWTAVVLLLEGAELALEVAEAKVHESPRELRKEAKAKRELAERVRKIVLELPTILASDGARRQ